MTDDLTGWLLAQITEDERVLNVVIKRTRNWKQIDLPWWRVEHGTPEYRRALRVEEMLLAVWDPDRLLAECNAKRRIVARHTPRMIGQPLTSICEYCSEVPSAVDWPCTDLRDIASVYADRPGYREEWKP